MVCTLIDNRNDVKMFKTLQWNRSSWFHLSFEYCDVISMVDKITDHGLLKPACNMTQNAVIGMR